MASSGDEVLHLGALERSGLLSLAALDDGEPQALPGSSAPPADAAPADVALGPAGEGARVPGGAEPARRGPPADRFAPPGADSADLVVELAEDELAYRARKRLSTPPGAPPEPARPPAAGMTPEVAAQPGPAAATAGPTMRVLGPAVPPGPLATPVLAPTTPRPAAEAPGTQVATAHRRPASPRVRLAAGLLLSIVLGFLPAHVVASVQEASAFRAIDARVIEAQAAVDSPQAYEALDALRATQLEAKRSAHLRIALVSMLIWVAAGSAIAYLWFRRVPWSR